MQHSFVQKWNNLFVIRKLHSPTQIATCIQSDGLKVFSKATRKIWVQSSIESKHKAAREFGVQVLEEYADIDCFASAALSWVWEIPSFHWISWYSKWSTLWLWWPGARDKIQNHRITGGKKRRRHYGDQRNGERRRRQYGETVSVVLFLLPSPSNEGLLLACCLVPLLHRHPPHLFGRHCILWVSLSIYLLWARWMLCSLLVCVVIMNFVFLMLIIISESFIS